MEFHAFLSYAQNDDYEYSEGFIEELRNRIEKETSALIGHRDFKVFRDKNDIGAGENIWQKIDEALDQTFVLIPLITPSYFESDACLQELEKFIHRENKLLQDLVIPVYFTKARDMEKDAVLENRPRVKRTVGMFKQRLYIDLQSCRETGGFYNRDGTLRQEVKDKISTICRAIRDKFWSIRSNEDEQVSNKTINVSPSTIPTDFNNSLYGERQQHFEQEKIFLANVFGEYLINRLRKFSVKPKENVLLFIDSGTTLLHFFSKLGRFAQESGQAESSWVNKVTIITNNLAGARWLMENARKNNESTAGLAIQCVVLPGVPSPVYSATVSPFYLNDLNEVLAPITTHHVIRAIYENIQSASHPTNSNEVTTRVISLLSGNWVRIRETPPRIALPLSRGQGQLEIKQALIDISDEVYLVAPLGKIFADSKEEVYSVLSDYISKSHHGYPYEEVQYDASRNGLDKGKIRLVTTYRPEGNILANLSNLLAAEDFFDAQKIDSQSKKLLSFKALAEFSSVPNLMFEFSPPQKDIKEQIQLEFPHKASQNRRFLKMFRVDPTVFNYVQDL